MTDQSDYQDDDSHNAQADALAALVNRLAARVDDAAALHVALVALVDGLAALATKPCLFAGRVTSDQVKVVLGNVANIWPASIAADVAQDGSKAFCLGHRHLTNFKHERSRRQQRRLISLQACTSEHIQSEHEVGTSDSARHRRI